MSKKNLWIYILAALVIVGGVYALMRNKKASAPTTDQQQTDQNLSQNAAKPI